MKFEIKNRWTGRVQYSCELEAEFAGKSISIQLGAAVKSAYKSRADLRDAVLRDAVLRDAVLSRADLSRAVLRDADLSRADLRLKDDSCCVQIITDLATAKRMNRIAADLLRPKQARHA